MPKNCKGLKLHLIIIFLVFAPSLNKFYKQQNDLHMSKIKTG